MRGDQLAGTVPRTYGHDVIAAFMYVVAKVGWENAVSESMRGFVSHSFVFSITGRLQIKSPAVATIV